MKQTNETEKIDEEQPNNWITEELNNLHEPYGGERLPSLKLESGKITCFKVNFSEPFKTYKIDQLIKKIIPVQHEGTNKILWLNVKNPLYREIIELGFIGRTKFKIMTTGSNKDTRYTILNDEKNE